MTGFKLSDSLRIEWRGRTRPKFPGGDFADRTKMDLEASAKSALRCREEVHVTWAQHRFRASAASFRRLWQTNTLELMVACVWVKAKRRH